MNAHDRVATLLSDAEQIYRDDPAFARQPAAALVAECSARFAEPLRIALAGTLKAGKSTLLNALIGEELAPSNATECTRIVTWFRHGNAPSVRAWHLNGMSAPVPVDRPEGHLNFDLDGLDPAAVDRLEVTWPSNELNRTTVIDTPGTASLNAEISARTMRLLAPDNGVSGADAVVYLMRSAGASDVNVLSELSRQVGGRAGPLGVIGVVSRADEIGVGRLDAMLSAKEVAAGYATELAATGLCQSVVPVAGLLALTARTLRQSEFAALQTLAAVPANDLQVSLLSADRFARENSPLPLPAEVRARLVRRFGLFGLRISVTLLQTGVVDSSSLATELLRRSGLTELQEILNVQFGQRADQLKVHSALSGLRRILDDYPAAATRPLLRSVDEMLSDVHGFEELRLIGLLRSRTTTLSESEVVEITRLIGGYGTSPDDRLGLDPFETMTSGATVALGAVQRWRQRARHPLNDAFSRRVCNAAARSAEGLVAEFASAREQATTQSGPRPIPRR
ncbi:dynamin family protein [Gordonia sp. CPCC 205333]|uniref:dynamin family protein n=1 Tax=Gordonia sp. CPCC 205333 TaxID=3140790 RepID=UPI003AF3CE9C